MTILDVFGLFFGRKNVHFGISGTPAQGPYVAARAGVEPMTLLTKGVDSTDAPHMPHELNSSDTPISLLWMEGDEEAERERDRHCREGEGES